MIDLKIDGNKKRIEMHGTIPELVAELYQGIGSVYFGMMESDEDAARIFKEQFIEDIEVAFMDAKEFEKHAKKKLKEILEEVIKSDWS